MANVIHDDDDLDILDEDLDDTVDEDAPELPVDPDASKADAPSESHESLSAVDDDDDVPYGKKVQRRIAKLTAKMRQYESETQFWRDKVEALESKTTAKEMTEFQNQVEWSASELAKQVDAARAAKKSAIEEGDVDRQIKADEQILELREQLAEKRRLATAAKEQVTQFHEKQTPTAPVAPAPIPDHLPSGTKQWLRSNPWFMKGSDARAVEFARTLDAALQEEGYSPDDATMYAELDKRLHVLVPRLAKIAKPPPKARVAGSSADGQRPESPNSKPARRLTSDDLVSMKRFGMNPELPAHRKAWLHRNDKL